MTKPVEALSVTLLTSGSPNGLQEEINRHIENGWKLYGHPYAYPSRERQPPQHCQMMVEMPNN